jgi:hypothetical protein
MKANNGRVGQLVVREALNLLCESDLWVRTPPRSPFKLGDYNG